MAIFIEWLLSINSPWLKLYLGISFVFMGYFFIRLISYGIKEIGIIFWRILWGAFVVPVILGLLWPLSIVNRIIMKRWIVAWMNNIHWWE